MGKCKTKAIETDLGTFRHNQASSKPCVSLAQSEQQYIQNRDIFKTRNILGTLVYSEPRCIEDSDIFKVEGLFRHLRCQVPTMKRFVKTANGKQFRNTSLWRSLLHQTNIMTQLLQRQLFYVKKIAQEGAGDREIYIIQINQPTCSQQQFCFKEIILPTVMNKIT